MSEGDSTYHPMLAIPRPARWRGGRDDPFDREKTVIFTQAMSVIIRVVVIIVVNFFTFSTSFLNPLHGLAWNFEEVSLGWTPSHLVKIKVLPLFLMEQFLTIFFANS